MNVLLVFEGPHEFDYENRHGALEILCRRLGLNGNVHFTPERVASSKVRKHMKKGKKPRLTKRALGWIDYAEKRDFDAIVLLVDEDGERDRISHVNEAQADRDITLPRALGVAVRMFDAWMLADEQALTKALGKTIQRQPDQETIQDPKALCTRLHKESDSTLRLRDVYMAIAKFADIETLRKRCPTGFTPFACRVGQLVPHS